MPVGIHHEAACLREIPGQFQLLAFPGFVQIAQGEFPQGVILVEIGPQQIINPVSVPGVVHMSIPVQIGKVYITLPTVHKSLGRQS